MGQFVRNFFIILPLLLVVATFAVINLLPPVYQLALFVGVPLALWGTFRLHLATDPSVAERSHEISVPLVFTAIAIVLAYNYATTMILPLAEQTTSLSLLSALTGISTVFAILRMQMYVAPERWSLINGPAHRFMQRG